MTAVSVVGSTGRVGAALVAHLTGRHEVKPVSRSEQPTMEELCEAATEGVAVVLNAAGVAHVDADDDATLARLRDGNVDLPVALARAALEREVGFIHISSSKARSPESSDYARSKAAGEAALERELATRFERERLSLVIIRPPAMLFPPLDAGRLRHLRFVRHLPSLVVPPVPLPLVTAAVFLALVESLVSSVGSRSTPPGLSHVEIPRSDRGTLRDVAAAFRTPQRGDREQR